MKYLFTTLLFCVLFISCKKKSEEYKCSKYYDYTCVSNRQLYNTGNYGQGPSFNFSDSAGNNTVFQYRVRDECIAIHSWCYTGYLMFQADSDATYFNYTDTMLSEHLTYYYSMFASPKHWGSLISKGNIQGVKQSDNTWKVSIDIELPLTDTSLHISCIKENTTFTYVEKLNKQ